MKRKKVLIAAGGSGGHLLPAQELAELLEKNHGCSILFAGFKLDKSPYFHREKFRHKEIVSSPLTAHPVRLLWALTRGFFSALKVLLVERPSIVVGFGSYHTVPVLLAAAVLRKKLVLYEANRVVGKVNRLFHPFAKAMAIQLPLLEKMSKTVAVSLFPWLPKPVPKKEDALRGFGLEPGRKTILVFGGSQGASFLNEIVPQVLAGKENIQVIHLTGKEETAQVVREAYRKANIPAAVKGFELNMGAAYRAADMAICRSGAGTTAELIRFEIPSVLIPYPYAADDHQRLNAEFLHGLGGAEWLLQADANKEAMQKLLNALKLDAMKLALRTKKEQHGSLKQIDGLVAQHGGWG